MGKEVYSQGPPSLERAFIPSPLGWWSATATSDGKLWELGFPKPQSPLSEPSFLPPWAELLSKALNRYLQGQRESFREIPVDLSRLSPFTQAVLNYTQQIPYGEVRSYRQVAEALGYPRSARAVGRALASNPIPLVIPCHRVIGSQGDLRGFGPGIEWKERLLRLERQVLNPSSPLPTDRHPKGHTILASPEEV